MRMEKVKARKNEYFVFKKRSGRYAVQGADGKWILGDDKVKILVKEGLLKVAVPKKKEEAPAEAAAEPAAEAPAEEGKAE